MPQRKNPHHTGTKPPAYTPNSPATARRRTEKHRSGASGNIEGIEKTGYTEMQRECRRTSGTNSPDGSAGQPLRKATQTNTPERIFRKPPRNTSPATTPAPTTTPHNNTPGTIPRNAPHTQQIHAHTQRLPRNNSRNEKQRAAPKCSPLFFCGSRSDYFALFLS